MQNSSGLPGGYGKRTTSFTVTPSQQRLATLQNVANTNSSSTEQFPQNTNAQPHTAGRATFKSVSPRFPSPSTTSDRFLSGGHSASRYGGMPNSGTNSANQLSDSTRHLLVLRKNNYRQLKLKNIDTENLKIFQNLLRIKSSLSKQKFTKQAIENNSIRKMLQQNGNKVDPLIQIEQKMRRHH